MHFTYTILSLPTLLALTIAGPVLTVHNTKTRTICLKVETSSGSFPTTTVCGGAPGINVAPMKTSAFYPSDKWNGAISDFTAARGPGTRLEINFSEPGRTWYDADMEFGISSATLGPTDHRKQSNGRASLAGEQDPLAKANAAWAVEKNRVNGFPKYLTPSKDGKRLVNVYMDKNAPRAVQTFFQLTAGFQAYLVPGSVGGVQRKKGSVEKMLEVAADQKAWKVDTQAMRITIF
ncbi:MAG: hypothetical protein Q9178_004763 [Gyalolechia marmorata]